MTLPDALRALAEEVDLWPEGEREQIDADLTRHIDTTTQQLREQRETSRRKR